MTHQNSFGAPILQVSGTVLERWTALFQKLFPKSPVDVHLGWDCHRVQRDSHHFPPHQTIQSVPVCSGWGRSHPLRDHTHPYINFKPRQQNARANSSPTGYVSDSFYVMNRWCRRRVALWTPPQKYNLSVLTHTDTVWYIPLGMPQLFLNY